MFTATGTTYTDFSNVAATSIARYAGNSAKTSSGGIQLRSKNSNSGIVSTTSGGTVKSVTVTVESGTPTVDIYGNNTAYTGATDMYVHPLRTLHHQVEFLVPAPPVAVAQPESMFQQPRQRQVFSPLSRLAFLQDTCRFRF